MFSKIKDSSFEDKLLNALLLGITAFLVLASMLSAFRSMVNADAGYYLGVTELIHKGYLPYRDFSLGYTPLFFYVLQVPRILMGPYPDYTGYMLFLYLIVAFDAFLLAVIIKRITNSVKFSWISALVFLSLYLYLDGAYFILEPFSLCCGLVSLILLVRRNVSPWRCVLSGSFCALAFLSKQYGLLFAGVVGTFLLLSDDDWKNRILHCLYAFAGFSIIIILFAALFILSGLELSDMAMALSGSTYGGQSLGLYAKGIAKTCRLFPYLFFLPCLLFSRKNQNTPLVWASCIGLLLASVQFYFNVFPHYYIFMLPFVLALNAMMWNSLKVGHKTRISFLLYFGILFTACAIPLQSVYKDTKSLIRHSLRSSQNKTTVELRKVAMEYQLDSALCYWNTIQYYGLCPLEPSSMKEYGFAFGSDTERSYMDRLKNADCFVVKKSDLSGISGMRDFSAILSAGFHLLDQEFADGAKVFVRK